MVTLWTSFQRWCPIPFKKLQKKISRSEETLDEVLKQHRQQYHKIPKTFSFIDWMGDKNINKPEIKSCLLLSINFHNLFTRIYFTSFVNALLSTALHASFHQTLAFALWISVIAENYQLKFPLSVDNRLKPIP